MAHGAKAKTGKRGYVGSMKTPVDALTGAARREYEGTGPVKTSSMYETIMPFDEFKALPKGRKMIALYELKKRHTVKALSEAWGTSEGTIYYYMRSLGCRDYESGQDAPENGGQPEQVQQAPVEQSQDKQPQPVTIQVPPQDAPPAPKASECDFQLHGSWSGADIAAKLQGLSMMCRPDATYWVNISWREF